MDITPEWKKYFTGRVQEWHTQDIEQKRVALLKVHSISDAAYQRMAATLKLETALQPLRPCDPPKGGQHSISVRLDLDKEREKVGRSRSRSSSSSTSSSSDSSSSESETNTKNRSRSRRRRTRTKSPERKKPVHRGRRSRSPAIRRRIHRRSRSPLRTYIADNNQSNLQLTPSLRRLLRSLIQLRCVLGDSHALDMYMSKVDAAKYVIDVIDKGMLDFLQSQQNAIIEALTKRIHFPRETYKEMIDVIKQIHIFLAKHRPEVSKQTEKCNAAVQVTEPNKIIRHVASQCSEIIQKAKYPREMIIGTIVHILGSLNYGHVALVELDEIYDSWQTRCNRLDSISSDDEKAILKNIDISDKELLFVKEFIFKK